MKLIIAGSRHLPNCVELIDKLVKPLPRVEEVVSGCARGVDTSGEMWAKLNNIPVKRFPADWERYKNSAGPIRNMQMARYADALLLIWDGKSKGSKHMLESAIAEKLEPILVYITTSSYPSGDFQ